jgi:hypothetical protein
MKDNLNKVIFMELESLFIKITGNMKDNGKMG